MKICLVQTPVPELKDDRLDPPMGLLYLATVLRDAGLDAHVLDLSGIPETKWNFPEAEWYGFSTYTASYNRTVRIKNLVKAQYPGITTIAGGPHASAVPHEVSHDFDRVVVGEGEIVLPEILAGLTDNVILHTTPVELRCLPIPDYSLVDVDSYTREFAARQSFQVFTSRGCPFNCGFCSKLPGCDRIRRRTPGSVVFEMKKLMLEYGDISFRFKDDLFASSVEWLQEYYACAPKVPFSCNVRADYHPNVPRLLSGKGCQFACMGIESGSDEVLRRMGKHTTREKNVTGMKRLQDVGIQVLAWIIIGYPGETWETFEETMSMLEEVNPSIITAYPLIPYPGTRVHEEVEILDKDYDHYFYIHGDYEAGFVYRTKELSREDIQEMFDQIKNFIVSRN